MKRRFPKLKEWKTGDTRPTVTFNQALNCLELNFQVYNAFDDNLLDVASISLLKVEQLEQGTKSHWKLQKFI